MAMGRSFTHVRRELRDYWNFISLGMTLFGCDTDDMAYRDESLDFNSSNIPWMLFRGAEQYYAQTILCSRQNILILESRE